MDSKIQYEYYKEHRLSKKPDSTLIIRTFVKDDLEDCAKCVAKTDILCNPFYIAINWDFPYAYQFFLEFLLNYLEERSSLVALLDGKIIGFIGCNDYSITWNGSIYEKYSELHRFGYGLVTIKSKLKEFERPVKQNEVAFVSSMVVDLEYHGLGIGRILLDFINYCPKLMVFKKILVTAASNISKGMIDNLGFKMLAFSKYTDFLDKDGNKPYEDLLEKFDKLGIGKENDIYSFHVLERNVSNL